MILQVLIIIYVCVGNVTMCHIPTLHHYDRFPPGGNVTGGNLLVGHHHHGLADDVYDVLGEGEGRRGKTAGGDCVIFPPFIIMTYSHLVGI